MDDQAYPDDSRAGLYQFVPESVSRVLDVGCWKGAFGSGLKEFDPQLEVHGVEPSEAGTRVARGRLDYVVRGEFPDVIDRLRPPYDLILFNDVLEHLVDPWEALAQCRSLVGARGQILVVLPNVRHVSVTIPLALKGHWTYTNTGLLDRTHLRFFTPRSAKDLVEGAGFSIETYELIDMSDIGLRGALMTLVFAAFGRRNRKEFLARHIVIRADAAPNSR